MGLAPPSSWMDVPWPGSWAWLGGTEMVPWSCGMEMSEVSEVLLSLLSQAEMMPWLGWMKMQVLLKLMLQFCWIKVS